MKMTREEVKDRLKARGYTQHQISLIAGVTPQMVVQVVAGVRKSARILQILRDLLGEPDMTIELRGHYARPQRK